MADRGKNTIPWWYWTIRFDFREHYRDRYERYRKACGGLTPLDKMLLITSAIAGGGLRTPVDHQPK